MDHFVFPSLLDKDDINGPGKGTFARSENGFSVDYALFKISLYQNIENTSDRIKFIKDIDVLILQLGKLHCKSLIRVFKTMVTCI